MNLEVRTLLRGISPAIGLFFFIVAAKLSGAIKEMAIARYYGINGQIDALNFATNTANTVSGLLVGMITLSLGTVIKQKNAELNSLLAVIRKITVFIGIVGAIFVYNVLTGPHIRMDLLRAVLLSTILVPTAVAAFYSSLSILQGKHLNNLAEGLPAVTVALTLAFTGAVSLTTLAFLTLAGVTLQAIFLIQISKERRQETVANVTSTGELWGQFSKAAAITLASQASMGAIAFIDNYLIVRSGQGALSTFSYASKTVSIPLSLSAVAISRYTLAYFVKANANVISYRTVVIASLGILLVSSSAIFATQGFTEAVVSNLYQGGSFSDENARRVSEITRLLVWQIPFYTAGIIFVSVFSTRQGHNIILTTAISALACKVLAYMAHGWVVTPTLVAETTVGMYALSFTIYLVAALNKTQTVVDRPTHRVNR